MLHSWAKKLLELNKNSLQTIEFLQGHYITHESFGHHANCTTKLNIKTLDKRKGY